MPNKSRIVVIGEALIDRFPNEDVVGGAPFNVARALAAFGANPLMITRVGADADADIVRDEFKRFCLTETALQVDCARPTGLVSVSLTANGHEFHIGKNQAWDAIERDTAIAAIAETKISAVCFGTLAQRDAASRLSIHAVLEAAKVQGATIFLDLNLRADGNTPEIAAASLTHADVVKVNDDELLQLIRWFVLPNTDALSMDSPALVSAAQSLIKQFSLDDLIVTRGSQGCMAIDAWGVGSKSRSAPAVAVVDTVGAGDSFLAVLVLGHTSGWTLDKTLARANAFAARVCTIRGAVSNDLNFYRHEQASWNNAT